MIRIGKSEVRISMVIKLAGAFCAFLIGAGFATGQEIMQYFTNYGIAKAVGVLVINGVLGAWTSSAVMNLGNESKDVQGLECYRNLCGKYVGDAAVMVRADIHVPYTDDNDGRLRFDFPSGVRWPGMAGVTDTGRGSHRCSTAGPCKRD